jgi:hypothetical protein
LHYKITKLNKRNTWHQNFSHRVEIKRHHYDQKLFEHISNFIMLRQWCCDNFGPSVETMYWEQLWVTDQAHLANDKWAWYVNTHDAYRTFLYFADEAALSFFKLNWPVTSKR